MPDRAPHNNDTGPRVVQTSGHGELAAADPDPLRSPPLPATATKKTPFPLPRPLRQSVMSLSQASVSRSNAHLQQGGPGGCFDDPDTQEHDHGAPADNGPDTVGAQNQSSPDGGPGPGDEQDDDDVFRPPDLVCVATPGVVVLDKIGWLQSLIEGTDDAQHRKNLQAAIDMVRSGVSFAAYQVIADGQLINGDEWRPQMGPFFVPVHVSVPLLSLSTGQYWRTNVYSSTNTSSQFTHKYLGLSCLIR